MVQLKNTLKVHIVYRLLKRLILTTKQLWNCKPESSLSVFFVFSATFINRPSLIGTILESPSHTEKKNGGVKELHSCTWHSSDQCNACVLLRATTGQVLLQQIQRSWEERKGERQKKEQRARGRWKRYKFETWEGGRMKRIRGKGKETRKKRTEKIVNNGASIADYFILLLLWPVCFLHPGSIENTQREKTLQRNCCNIEK